MTKTKIFTALALLVLAAVFTALHYRTAFYRVQRVQVEGTSTQQSLSTKLLLRNNSSGKIEFPLHCYGKIRPGEKPLFSQVVVLQPKASLEFDVYPELAGREMPRMIADRACEAVWQGPFGIERGAWQVRWQGRSVHKTISTPR